MQISAKILDMLNKQIAHEGLNAQKYALIGAELKNIGLDNIGDHFFSNQVLEEQSHQQMIRKYIVDRNERVLGYSIPEFTFQYSDIFDVANLYLTTEKETTSKLKTIAVSALTESDLITYDFIMGMIKIQEAEEAEALSFFDKAKLSDGNPEILLLWDANFKL